jgi:hypothetical protein
VPTDALAVARALVSETLASDPSVLAAVVGGSVARGDATPASDLDVRFIVDVPDADRVGGTEWFEWRDCVFVDAAYERLAKYADTESALADPYFAGSIREALILHDQDGVLAEAQADVRERFGEPRWLAARLAQLTQPIERNARDLRPAAAERDHVTVARTAIFALWTVCDALLVLELRSPSWVRSLQKVGDVRPADRNRIVALEGTEALTPERARDLIPLFRRVAGPEPGLLMDFVVGSVEWMIDAGLHREAVHGLWATFALTVGGLWESDDPAARRLAESTCSEWLSLLGWSDAELPARAEALADYAAGVIRAVRAVS